MPPKSTKQTVRSSCQRLENNLEKMSAKIQRKATRTSTMQLFQKSITDMPGTAQKGISKRALDINYPHIYSSKTLHLSHISLCPINIIWQSWGPRDHPDSDLLTMNK